MKKPSRKKPTPPIAITPAAHTPNPTTPDTIRVSISEAAKLFGVNPQTVRRAIQAEEVSYIVVANRYKLNFESLILWSQKKTTVHNKSNKRGIGQYIEKWKIKNPLYSPSIKNV
ncbi:MAG TPA: hypothetical protein PLV72_03075 [Candidatus Magasanikbacteria bacterium]|nr:hypothetical protein [Candidatus Magasanikbacteria bacterium]